MFRGFLDCVTMLKGSDSPVNGKMGGVTLMTDPLLAQTRQAVTGFTRWLEAFGETSQGHQDFYASRVGRAAKALYYRRPWLGTLAVAPMVFCEAFAPSARFLFFSRMRLPIADAHYAMGFAFLHQTTRQQEYYDKAVHFLDILEQTRSPGYERHGWGYPFHWQTRGGLLKAGTPLITTTPYCYEAFAEVFRIDGKADGAKSCSPWPNMSCSITRTLMRGRMRPPARYARTGAGWSTQAPTGPLFLPAPGREFGNESYWRAAERNLNFVLQSQQEDGSWPSTRWMVCTDLLTIFTPVWS